MNIADSDILKVLEQVYPDWEAPDWKGTWNKCLCPVHNEQRPSCSVSYELNAVRCQSCGFRGTAESIARKEGITLESTVNRKEGVSPGGRRKVSRRTFGEPSRDVPSNEGASRPRGSGKRRSFPTGLR